MKIQYSSNNSGGSWWLTDEDWYALEKAGWKVLWCKDEMRNSLFKPDKDGRWLGALAKYAEKDFETPGDAMREFEKITGQDVSDEGCNCCGAPHNFRWGRAIDDSLPRTAEFGSVYGEECLQYLFPNKTIPKNLREAMERE